MCTLYIFFFFKYRFVFSLDFLGLRVGKGVFFIFPKKNSSSSNIILSLRRLNIFLTFDKEFVFTAPGVGTTAQGTENFAREVKLEKKKHQAMIKIILGKYILWFDSDLSI